MTKLILEKLCERFYWFGANDVNPEAFAIVENGMLMYDTIGRFKDSVINTRPHTWWMSKAKENPKDNKLVRIKFFVENV